jgi:hypothetical protein
MLAEGYSVANTQKVAKVDGKIRKRTKTLL